MATVGSGLAKAQMLSYQDPSHLSNAGSIELHCFSDACELGTVRCATFGLLAVLPGAVNLSSASPD